MREVIAALIGLYAAVGFVMVTGFCYAYATGTAYSVSHSLIAGVGVGGAIAGFLLRKS